MRISSMRGMALRAALSGAAGLALAGPAAAQEYAQLDLSGLSLEELANVEITSVSKRPEPVGQAPASVFVVSNDDIRRSAAQSLPEALRLAPNLHVARMDANDYAISARGFNGFETSNKLLVLIDGRSIYTPFHSGVLWDAHQVMLEDVERVEVISGPGGALWGANAVNGVVNVISRSARDTQGLLFSAAGGEVDKNAAVRYGGRMGEAGAFRVYAMGYERGHSLTLAGEDLNDEWDGAQAGFRLDLDAGGGVATLQGDVYYDRPADEGYLRGGNVLGRWSRALANGSTVEVQAYVDKTVRYTPAVGAAVPSVYESVETIDLEFQQAFAKGPRHAIVWGGGYRSITDEFLLGQILIGGVVFPYLEMDPPHRRLELANVFVQDEIALGDDLSLTLGLKLEHGAYSDLEYLPSARLAWRPTDQSLLWAAVSRAVRTPSRVERDLAWEGVIQPHVFETETLVAYEGGYRAQMFGRTSLSVSVFYNQYDDLRTNEAVPPGPLPIAVGNGLEGESWGTEIWGGYDVTDSWRLSAGFTALRKDFREKAGHDDGATPVSTGNDPEHQFLLRSQANLFSSLELDLMLRAVDELPVGFVVDDYVELDAKVGWRVTPETEVYLAGTNLLDEARREAGERTTQALIRRNIQAGLRWRF